MTKEQLPGGPDSFEGILESIALLTQEQRQSLLDALNDPVLEEQARLNELKRLGESLSLKKVRGGNFICIEGKGYTYRHAPDEVFYPANKTDDWGFELRKKGIGHYAMNNSVLSYIDEEGNIYVGFYTSENIQALKEAGYLSLGSEFSVYFSNGEYFVDEKWQKKREQMFESKKKEYK